MMLVVALRQIVLTAPKAAAQNLVDCIERVVFPDIIDRARLKLDQ